MAPQNRDRATREGRADADSRSRGEGMSPEANLGDILSDNVEGRTAIDATPKARDIFLGYTRGGYTITAAVAEYVDNAIEQARVSGKGASSAVHVNVGAWSPNILIEIDDDAGGCPRSQAVRFIQRGLSCLGPDET